MQIRTILVLVSLVLSVGIGFAIANRSGSAEKSDGRIVIGLSMDTQKEARWIKDRDSFVSRCKALGAEVLVQSANSDDTRQIQDVNSLIASKVRALVIIPHNGVAMATAVKAANKAGIPVVAYDRMIMDCDLDLYLSFDNIVVGEKQAQYLVDHLPTPGRGKIVRIYGAPTDNNAKLFKRGQDNVLKPYIDRGDIQVLHEDWADDWSPANAKKIMNAAITKYKTGFDGVLASNDGTAGGAIQSLKEAGVEGPIVVTGQDADLVACQRIVAGTQAVSIYKPVKNLAERAAELAVAMAKAKPVIANGSVDNGFKKVPSVLLEVVAVDKDNMRQTVIADGFHTETEVYGTQK